MAKRLPPSVRNFKPPPPPPKPVDTFGLINLAREHRQPPPPGGGYMLSAANPALTSPTATATGATTATLTVSSNRTGTLYWIVTVNATTPTVVQIKAGLDGTGAAAAASNNQAISAIGTQTSLVTGLVSNTAYNAFWTTDLNVAPPTATFTTAFDPAVVSWAAAVVTNGGTVSNTRKALVNTLVAGLKTDGVWTKLDRLWIMAAENTASALTDMVADALATVNGSPTFTTDRGYTGTDATTPANYIDSGFNPASAGGNFTQNSAHMSFWSSTNVAPSNGGAAMGSFGAGGYDNSFFMTLFSDNNVYGRINDNPFSAAQGIPTTRHGHWVVNRSGASASQIYQNGSSFSSPNQTSGAMASFTIFLTCANNSGTQIYGNPNTFPMFSIGGNLSSTNVSNFFTRLQTYMTAVGAP